MKKLKKSKYSAYNAGGTIQALAPLAGLIPGAGAIAAPAMSLIGGLISGNDQPTTYRGATGTNTNPYGYASGGGIKTISPNGAEVIGGKGIKDGVKTIVDGTKIKVDHGEVISRIGDQPVVFSHRLKDPRTGVSFADTVKPVEKALQRVKLPSVINDNTRKMLESMKSGIFTTQEQIAGRAQAVGVDSTQTPIKNSFGEKWGEGYTTGGAIMYDEDGNPIQPPEFPPITEYTTPAQSALARFNNPQALSNTPQATALSRGINPMAYTTNAAGLPYGTNTTVATGIVGNNREFPADDFARQLNKIKTLGGIKSGINQSVYRTSGKEFGYSKGFENMKNEAIDPELLYSAIDQAGLTADLGKTGKDYMFGPKTSALYKNPKVYNNYQNLVTKQRGSIGANNLNTALTNGYIPPVGANPTLNYQNNNKLVSPASIPAGKETNDKMFEGDVPSLIKPKYTTGDLFQFGAVGAQVAGTLLDKPEKQQAYLDRSQITKQVYNPSRAYNENQYASNAAGMSAANNYSSAGVTSALQNINANKYRANAQITTQYDQMNKEAEVNYEQRRADQSRFNQQARLTSDVANQQNRAAYTNNIYSALESVNNLGAGLNQRETQLKGLEWLAQVDPEAYKAVMAQKLKGG